MYRCKNCGDVIVAVEMKSHHLDKDREYEEIYSEGNYYECTGCYKQSTDLDEIAEWTEDANEKN